jgi:hypothetical protein
MTVAPRVAESVGLEVMAGGRFVSMRAMVMFREKTSLPVGDPFRQGHQLAEGQKRAKFKHFLIAPPPPPAN